MKNLVIRLRNFLKENIVIILVLLIYVLICFIFDFKNCPFALITGLPCPGCGITRAIYCVIKLDFLSAFNYHPLVFILPFIVIICIFKDAKYIKNIYQNKIFWIFLLGLVCITYILRLIFVFPNEPLKYYENNLFNLIYKFFQSI